MESNFKSMATLEPNATATDNVFAPFTVRKESVPDPREHDPNRVLKPCGRVVRLYALQDNTWHGTSLFLARVILEALTQFKHMPRNGFPVNDIGDYDESVESPKWEASLDKMIAAFTLLDLDARGEWMPPMDQVDADIATMDEGLLEFAAHFRDLWD